MKRKSFNTPGFSYLKDSEEKQMRVLNKHLLERQFRYNQITMATDGQLPGKSLILRDSVTQVNFF